MKMGCAPVIIATLNRSQHFIRLVESLKRNTWAKYTDVFVGLDYPPSEKYFSGYNQICDYLSGDFPEFASFHVIRREVNVGSIKNFAMLRDYVLARYDRFIRTDDDAEFSPNFLEYINKCLDKYDHDDNVVAVCGYSYPLSWIGSCQSSIIKANFNCSMWGTGFWKQKYIRMIDFIESGGLLSPSDPNTVDKAISRMIDVAKYEYLNLCVVASRSHNLVEKMSDISVRLYMALNNKWVIIPKVSKVRNWGFDGSGVYCPEVIRRNGKQTAYNYDYRSQEIDCDTSFILTEDNLNDVVANKRILNRFDALPLKSKIRLYIKLGLLKFLGVNNYVKLFS